MSGRNSHPKRDGERSNPSRLDQFGETLANDTEVADELANGARFNQEKPQTERVADREC
ncbi:hypothetical protein [Paenibacillus thermotolerans]|uniref:hypothetical protein n=1 Tax=Paenibacillus thermotolerans TaxID=3027807 RepID=UPI0023688C1E|nr:MULTISPECIES: hypothetical protein [unclassified Paenibacillus]